MSDIPNIPTKLNEDCSLIQLIDENQCVGNSMDVINSNFSNLSSALIALENYATFWNNAYTTFQANSSIWLVGSARLQQYNSLWNSAYSTVQSLSSGWSSPFVVYYPQIILIDDWNSKTSYYTSQVFPDWITTNFSPQMFVIGQQIYIQVNLYQVYPFSFVFKRDYNETCAPLGGTTISCGECGRPSRGCNHHGGNAGWGPCDNAFSHCGVTITSSGGSFSCQGTGGQLLTISKQVDSVDTNIARISTFKYQNNGSSWSLIS